MELPNKTDFLIVGAGPSGAMAALTLASKGVTPLLIDAKPRIGGRPHCGEFVSRRIFYEYPESPDCAIQTIERMRTLIDYEDVSDPIPSPGYMIHRPGLDRGLARAAGAKGALVCSGASFKGLDHGEAIISFKGGLKSIRAGIIIAADGADSRVAKILNLPKPDYLGAAQVEVPLKRGLKDTMVFFHKDFRFGYGWLFPKKEVANAGLASDLGGSQSLSHLLDRFLRKLIDLDLILPGVLARGGGVISVSGLKKTLVSGNLILCGDAGGLTHPITGAGILSALDSGRCAAERAFEYLDLGDKDALEYYQDLMREKYGAIYDHALKKRAVMRKQWDHADFQDLIRNTWIGFDGYKRRERV